MRIITLNICHGGGQRGEPLAALILSLQPHVVVLTEFRIGEAGARILENLAKGGLSEVQSAARLPRKNSVCVVAVRAFEKIELPLPCGDDHRILLCDFGDLRLLATYFPQNEQKRRVFQFMRSIGLPALGTRGIMLGDLNTGLHGQDEAGATFYCADEFSELLATGLIDSWRSRNPQAREFSWFSAADNGFRIDHALCTPSLDKEVNAITYDHRFRELGVTDHSALVVDITSHRG
ncbi:MAG: endonuclease/exonuclease/phosphatase family protein [Betaproteobacteria bacterium]|jgi:exonuclease III